MIASIIEAIVLLALLFLFAAFIALTRRKPQVFLVILGVITLIAWEFPALGAIASPGGYSIYILDLLSIAFVVIALLDIRQLHANIRSTSWLWIILALLFLTATVNGVSTFGANSAVNEARGFTTLISAMIWALSLNWRSLKLGRLIGTYVPMLGWSLTIAAVYHGMRYGIGGASDFVDANGLDQTGRILVSGQAMVVGLCAMVCLHLWLEKKRRMHLWSSIVFAAIVLISQHRSVWVAIASAWLAYSLFGQRNRRSAAAVIAMVAAWGVSVVLASGMADGMITQIRDSSENTATYDARTSSWQYLISKAIDKGPETLLLGAPFGSGFDRIEPNGLFVTFQPHNIYVSVFLRLGLIGLGAYIALLLYFLFKNLKTRNMVAVALQIAVVVYGWAYGPTWYFFVFIAIFMVEPVAYFGTRNPSGIDNRDIIESDTNRIKIRQKES
jgi:hypothetical protein